MPKNEPIIRTFDWRNAQFTVPEPSEITKGMLFSIQDEMRKQIQAECERVISAGHAYCLDFEEDMQTHAMRWKVVDLGAIIT